MKKKLLTIYLVCLSICTIFADNNDLLTGLDAYSRGDWTTAMKSFKRAFTTANRMTVPRRCTGWLCPKLLHKIIGMRWTMPICFWKPPLKMSV